MAAAKIVPINDEAELEDFMVEIDILSECKNKHVVDMFQAYVHDSKLWVCYYCLLGPLIFVGCLKTMSRVSNDSCYMLVFATLQRKHPQSLY